MVGVAVRAARSRLPEQLRPCSQALSRQTEQRHRCSQTLRYARPILGGQPLADDVSLSLCKGAFFHLDVNGVDNIFSPLLVTG